jgi:hypothetical protein
MCCFIKLPHSALAGFDLMTHSSSLLVPGGDNTARPRRQALSFYCSIKKINFIVEIVYVFVHRGFRT